MTPPVEDRPLIVVEALSVLRAAGFRTAEEVAEELGWKADDVRRSAAAPIYVGSIDWQTEGVPRCQHLWRTEDVNAAPKRWRPAVVV